MTARSGAVMNKEQIEQPTSTLLWTNHSNSGYNDIFSGILF